MRPNILRIVVLFLNLLLSLLLGALPSLAMSQPSLPKPLSTAGNRSMQQTTLPYAYNHPYKANTVLPLPHPRLRLPHTLTLHDAIMLALRVSPAVVASELTRISDRYALLLAKQPYRPSYSITAQGGMASGLSPSLEANVGVGWQNMMGTSFNLSYNNAFSGHSGTTTATVTQHLLKGFGRVNRVNYLNGLTRERIAKLAYKSNLIKTLTAVITGYRTLVQDYNNLAIQKKTLKESAVSLRQYELEVKVGRMAPSDLAQQRANYAGTKLQLLSTQNALQQDYQSLLSTLGLVPTARLNIVHTIMQPSFKLPSETEAITQALKGNIAYQQALLNLKITKRAILTAKDALKWGLDLAGSKTFGSDSGGSNDSSESGSSVTLNLSVPIDNVKGKAGLVNARVAYQQAELALEQQKEDLIRQVMTQLKTLRLDQRKLAIAQTAVKMSQLTLNAARIKLKHGRSTVFEVNTDQDNLLSQQTNLIAAQIGYLNDMTALHELFGETLSHWHVHLK